MADRKQGQGRGKPGKRTGGSGGARSGRGKGRGGQDDPAAQLAAPLRRVLERLPATQREVLEWRMGLKDGHPRKLTDVAQEMGLSMSEAREIEQRAFEHIREAVPVEHLQKYLQG